MLLLTCCYLPQESAGSEAHGDNSTFLALDEDDFQTVIIENKLGCDIYLKKNDNNSDTVELLHHDDSTCVSFPPPRYSDRLNIADDTREPRCYVAIQIVEAKVLIFISFCNLLIFIIISADIHIYYYVICIGFTSCR